MTKICETSDLKSNKFDSNNVESTEEVAKYIGTNLNIKHDVYWYFALPLVLLNFFGFLGLITILQGTVQVKTVLWMLLIVQLSNFGISIGAHRYWCHKSFKAKPLLEVILIILYSISGTLSIITWVKKHRLHHRYSDTDADPHNINRGVFFCYMGWLLYKPNHIVEELEKKVDMTDLLTNKFVMFHEKYFYLMHFVFSFFIPTLVPVYFFNETLWQSFLIVYGLGHAVQLNYTFALVVTGHTFGTRPYDKNIRPAESWIFQILSLGDANHNYHHVFANDYKLAEGHNLISLIILLCEKLGLAYDLKVASRGVIKNRVLRTGDGTHHTVGADDRRPEMTAIGPLHPLNPTYKYAKHPEITARVVGPKSMFADFDDNGLKNIGSSKQI